jgi:hypothetical protein
MPVYDSLDKSDNATDNVWQTFSRYLKNINLYKKFSFDQEESANKQKFDKI